MEIFWIYFANCHLKLYIALNHLQFMLYDRRLWGYLFFFANPLVRSPARSPRRSLWRSLKMPQNQKNFSHVTLEDLFDWFAMCFSEWSSSTIVFGDCRNSPFHFSHSRDDHLKTPYVIIKTSLHSINYIKCISSRSRVRWLNQIKRGIFVK